MTTGLLEWGQAGSYNAPDDRRALTAMAAGHAAGVVNPVVLTAGSGLNVNVAANWLAVVDCGDSTLGVIGTASALVVPGSAGDAGAPRTDSLWCDINPTNGTFALVIIPQSAESGRQGTRLATITVPTGANLASAFTLTPRVASFADFPAGFNLGTSTLWRLSPENPAGWLKILGGAGVPVFVESATGRLAPGTPGSLGVPETWHAMTLLNNWSLTSGNIAHYRKTIENELKIMMYLNYGSTVTSANICSLPSGWRPAVQQQMPIACTAAALTGQSPYITVTPGGTVSVGGLTYTTTGTLVCNGAIPLAAIP